MLLSILSIFVSDILPIFIVAGVGFLLARFTEANTRTLSQVIFLALTPCLIFNTLTSSRLDLAGFGRMSAFCLANSASMALLARLVAVPLRLDRAGTMAFVLVVMVSNGGNYGLPVAMFAFGPEVLAFATAYFVTSSLVTYTAGVFLAAAGTRTAGDALIGVLRMPALYGAIAAAVVLGLGLPVPPVVERPVSMMSAAALPLMVLVLGMQLQRAMTPDRPAVVAAAAALSLLAAPLVGIGVATAIGLTGPAFSAAVLQASMPTAVVTTILALQFNVQANFVTSVVFVTTVLSPVTLSLLIAYLRG